ncbi:MAG: metallophosphoesterase [Rhodocyclaceae bacterium]|nr:metallophosphoesterase [Rhodocyclaceae bacterium]
MAAFNIAVLSDLHAYVGDGNASNSLLGFGTPTSEKLNPLLSLVKYATDHGITADALVCPGDICNQADIDGFGRAWKTLHDLNDALRSSFLLATCGNHDLDSRYLRNRGADDPDPKGALLCLTPKFPFNDIQTNNQFWAHNFAFVDLGDSYCALVLNTSAYHGGSEGEIDHGRVSQRTIDAILVELTRFPNRGAYVLICHHHLLPMTGWETQPDYQYVHKGTALLEALETATRTSWLVIHGHRHHPRLVYGPAVSTCAPIIFGSSSLGARMTGVPNQFHVISIEESDQPEHASIVGTVKTWSWTVTTGWIQSGRRSAGMPTICGFGFKGQVGVLADQVSRFVGSSYVTWNDAVNAYPSLRYLTPEGLIHFDEALLSRGFTVLFDTSDLPAQIGPRAAI